MEVIPKYELVTHHALWPPSAWSPEWALVFVTVLLIVATGFLALYTLRLWKDTKSMSERQAKEMEASLNIARDVANAATSSAAAAVRSAEATVQSAQLAHLTYITANPPRLTIGNFEMHKRNPPLTASFVIHNEGGTKAEIVRVDAYLWQFEIAERIPDDPPLLNVEAQVDPRNLDKGESTTPVSVFKTEQQGVHYLYDDFDFAFNNLYVIGSVRYRDEIGKEHKTVFCRRYNDDEQESFGKVEKYELMT